MASIICRYNGTSEKICYDSFNMSVSIYVNGTLINYTNTYPVTSDDVVEFVLTTNKIKSNFFYK